MRENSVTTRLTSRVTKVLVAVVFAALAAVGVAAPAAAAPTAPAVTAAPVAVAPAASSVAAQPSCGDTASYTKVDLSSLPSQATDTVNLIKQGGPYPYPQDNTVFSNREGILPSCSSGYYHEYTVKTPGSSDRGARRIVKGSGGEYFYTGDHYASFQLVDINA